jgi:multidrug efflux pump
VAGVTLYLQPVQDLTIDAESGPTQYRVRSKAPTRHRHRMGLQAGRAACGRLPQLRNVTTDAGATGPAMLVDIDRDTASRLGITAAAIDDALYSAFGQRIVSTIFTETNQYRVILEAHPDAVDAAVRWASCSCAPAPASPRRCRRWPHQRTAGAAADHARGAVPGHHARLRHRARRVAGAVRWTRSARPPRRSACRPAVTMTFLGAAGAYEAR